MSKINAGQAPSTLIPEYIGSDFDAVLTCADNINDVKTVSTNISDVVTVADNILNVNTIATDVSDVVTVADNIDYVKDVAEGIEGLPVSGYISDTPPTQPKVGATWYCTRDGRNYTWYEDADSGQWVESSPQSTADDPHLAGNIFTLWKRSAAEAGYNLVAGSFEEGGVLTSSTDVLWHKGLDSIYSWTGAFPKVVAPGTDPAAIAGFVMRSDAGLRGELDGGGSLALPYAVINVDLPPYSGNLGAALDAAPAGATLLLGNRDYNIVGKFRLDTVAYPSGSWSGIEKKNIKIIGSGMPELAADERRFISGSGTVIQGALINFADGFECWNLGVDVGDYVVDTLASGTHMEGFVPGTHKLNTAWNDAESAYINDVHFGNIKILLKQPVAGNSATEKHACLVERIDGGSHGYVECIGGTHGYVMKSRNFHRNGIVRCWRQVNDAAIFKTDAFTECGTSHGGTLVVGKEGHAVRTGKVLFQAANGTRLKSLSFDYVGVNCSGLERVYDGSTTRLEDVSILSAYVDGSDATAITIPSIGDRWYIGEHTIKNAPYGIGSESGCVQCTIGDGSVTLAGVDGYRLAGDIQHGVLSAKSCGGYGVKNNGCVVNPSRINGADNVSGNLSGLFNATGFITVQNGWLDASDGSTFGADIHDGKFVMRGRLGSGTGNVLFVVASGFRPRTDKWFCVTGHNGTARVAAFIHVVASTGQVILDDYATFAGGAAAGVAMDGLAWEYL